MPHSTPILTVVCTTYNQEQYIIETLDGFVSQRCSYPFDVIVHDDASTDGTADIVRSYAERYPALIKPIIRTENQYSKQVDILQEIIRNHTKAKYIAICEGDDYWTDPLKLQKQIDYMESNPDCGLTYTKALSYIEQTKKFGVEIGRDAISFEKVLRANPITTLTTLMTREVYIRYTQDITTPVSEWKMGDYPIWLYIACTGKIHFMDYVSGVYRILPNSASHFNDTKKAEAFFGNCTKIREFFAEKYQPDLLPVVAEFALYEKLYLACSTHDKELLASTRSEMRERADYKTNKRLWLSHKLSLVPSLYLLALMLANRLKNIAK